MIVVLVELKSAPCARNRGGITHKNIVAIIAINFKANWLGILNVYIKKRPMLKKKKIPTLPTETQGSQPSGTARKSREI